MFGVDTCKASDSRFLNEVELVICNGRQSVSLSKHEQSQAKWHNYYREV